MEVTTRKASVNQIDFLKQDSEASATILYRFFPEKPSGTRSSSSSTKELDLSLKLSLAGPYGQNQNAEEMPLTRSSTIAGEINFMGINWVQGNSFAPSLDRSSSLPLEAERALVRFGDLQTMRRAETGKRWLQDKLRRAAEEAAAEANVSPATAAASMVPVTSPAVEKLEMLANPSPSGKSSMLEEGTFVTDLYDMPYTVPIGLAEVGASSNMQASINKGKDIAVPLKTLLKENLPMPADTENPSKRAKLMGPCGLRSDDLKILRKMPSVTTTGDGPGGKRIQGFLYTYRKGQVYIVCVCHGHFLSPTEFVMHAGGTDVANPMKHIRVHSHSF